MESQNLLTTAEYLQQLKAKKKKKSKYKSIRCEVDGIKFPSELERNVYLCLKHLKSNGIISHFHRQVVFDLPGGYKHLVDFMAITHSDNRVIYIESKGIDLALGRLKRVQASEIYGVTIHLITAPNQVPELFAKDKTYPQGHISTTKILAHK